MIISLANVPCLERNSLQNKILFTDSCLHKCWAYGGEIIFRLPPTRWQTEKLFIYFVLKFPRPTNIEVGASRGFSE